MCDISHTHTWKTAVYGERHIDSIAVDMLTSDRFYSTSMMNRNKNGKLYDLSCEKGELIQRKHKNGSFDIVA